MGASKIRRESGTVGAKNPPIFLALARREPNQRCGRRRGYGIKDAEQGMRVALGVALDHLRIIEVVAGIHDDTFRQPTAHVDLIALAEQRDLDSVDLVGVLADQVEHGRHGGRNVGRAPIAGEGGVEAVTQPMQDHLALGLPDQLAVDRKIVVGSACGTGKRTACHDDHAAAKTLDGLDLLLISPADPIEGQLALLGELVRAGATRQVCAGDVARRLE